MREGEGGFVSECGMIPLVTGLAKFPPSYLHIFPFFSNTDHTLISGHFNGC